MLKSAQPSKSDRVAPILHVDMDSFFASVELRERPEIQHLPVAIAHDAPRAVISTANYPARKFGVGSALSVAIAKQRCPSLILIPPDYAKYSAVSEQVFSIFERYTPEIERLGLDEAFLGVGGAMRLFGSPRTIAERIRSDIKAELDLPASVGIAGSKFVAKIASDEAKPDGVCEVLPQQTRAFLDPLAVNKIWGVGKVTASKLASRAIHTIGDLAHYDLHSLEKLLGENQARHLHQLARGIDGRRIQTAREEKSVSHETTFSTDLSDLHELEGILAALVEKTARRLRHKALLAQTLTLKLKWHDFSTTTRSYTHPQPLDTAVPILQQLRELLASAFTERTQTHGVALVRLLGVQASGLVSDTSVSPTLWADESIKWHSIDHTLDELHERYSELGITTANLLPKRRG